MKALLVSVLLCGCTILPNGSITQGWTPEQINALAQDKSNLCIHVTYGPASFSLARLNPQIGSVATCNNEGMTVTVPTTKNSVEIPMTIRPSFTIAPK